MSDIDFFHQIYLLITHLLFAYVLSLVCLHYSGDKQGGVYYFNIETRESIWEHPVDIYYRKVIQEAKEKKRRAATDPAILQANHTEPQTRKKKVSLKAGGGKAGGDVLKPRPVLGPISGSSVEVVLCTRVYVVLICKRKLNDSL